MSLQIEGLERVTAKIARIMDALRDMSGPMSEAVQYLDDNKPAYPPPPPNSSYVRTGLLQDSYYSKVEPLASGVQGIFGNRRPSGGWVISDRPTNTGGAQAEIHRGRWHTLQGYARSKWTQVKAILGKGVHKAVES